MFRFFYRLYRILHFILTGIHVKVGNFSVIPAPLLEHVVVVAELWNHYAAAIFKSRISFEMIPTSRGKRLAGESQMNFVALVSLGLSAVSVFSELVAVRLLIGVGVITCLIIPAIPLLAWNTLNAPAAMQGAPLLAAGLLLSAFFNLILLIIVFVFFTLSGRHMSAFLPLRDYSWFISKCETVFQRESGVTPVEKS